ncbi:MAG: hypothetical protein JOZ51_16825 [Chloroflexi bacterium]|nr:hypothetical protein [Chloroflexota bacterium]
MLSPELGRLGFRIAIFVTLASGALLPAQRPGSAEFVLMATALAIGLVFLLIMIALIRWSLRRECS